MKENETIKLYGKELNTWKHWVKRTLWNGKEWEGEVISQYEIAYKEYDADGELHNVGSEDFSAERYNTLKTYEVWTWDGIKVQKYGKRWFERQYIITINPKDRQKAMDLMRIRFPKARMIDLRVW